MEGRGRAAGTDPATGTLVVLPSPTFAVAELRKITGIQFYEERMLFLTLLLRAPELRMVYLTSLPVDEAIVRYYLRFLPDPDGARRRLVLLHLDDPSPLPLTEKLLHRPEVLAQVRDLAGPADDAHVLPFNITWAEHDLTELLGLPVYGPHPDLVPLGSKSGSRQVARRAGVPVLPGTEDLFGLEEVEKAVAAIRAERPETRSVVIKLNDGFSGQGNAIVHLDGLASPLPASDTTFCAGDESWPSFAAKIAQGGSIVEALIEADGLVSPSVQVRIAPSGSFEVISTHDQILGGPRNQVYLGCRFPADPVYRLAIQSAALDVAEVLASEGVIGSFGIDFLVVPGPRPEVYLSEINLRMGGTTHPYWMTRLATGAVYDTDRGELLAGGRPRCYVATDNLKSKRLVGRTPAEVIDAVDRAGLAYDPATATGAALHLMGAIPGFGKMGATCIAESTDDADELSK
ncbi:MAG: peptide ligase PGM1-related protein, partial [Acidimicrobiales bacterium]